MLSGPALGSRPHPIFVRVRVQRSRNNFPQGGPGGAWEPGNEAIRNRLELRITKTV